MYLRDTDPLPPNSGEPSSNCYDWGVCLQKSMAQSVANAKAASATIAGPDSFSQFGSAVVIDVARSQNARAAADSLPPSQPVNVARELMAAPKEYPLNVTEEEFDGCQFRSGALLPTVPPKQQRPIYTPAPVAVPQTASAPRYGNLCWALRNRAVDQSQFDPAEFQALSYRCTQLGYAGACISPPNVALWLDQQRRAGTLPHISVNASDLDSIPPAPNLSGVNCPTSYQLGGMAGYRRRGMGAPWGDAGSLPAGAGWPGGSSTSSKLKAILFFGAVGVGLYMMAGQHGRS